MTAAGRLFLLSVLPLAAACGGLFWFFVARLDLAADQALERRASSNAAAVARGVAASFEYEDAGEVDRHLASLAQLPDLYYAAVLTADGRVFGAHRPERRPEIIARPRDGARLRWSPDVLHVVAPIETPGGHEGTLAMGFSLEELRSDRRTTLLVVGAAVGLVLAGGGVVAWLLAHFLGRRRAAEAAQRRSEESFRALIETLPDAILIEREGRVVYANPAAVRHLGVPSAAAIYGRPSAHLLRFEAHSDAPERLKGLHVAGQPVSLPDVQLVRPDGTALAAEVLALPLVFDAAPAGVLVARDLTERKRIQAQLIHADRMASMGTMAAGVAHEINNPMAYVTTNLSFALDELQRRGGGSTDDEVQQALHEALEGAERVRHIVQSLKTYSRAEDETVVPVDVERALDAALSMARAEMRPRAELVRTRGGVPLVSGQESRLVQVFVNLLTNAAQAIPAGDPERQRIEVATSVDSEGQVVVAITDTGTGIPPDHLARLFDPFFTTKPVGEGTGLGLSICHGIITGLGGRILVQSRLGAGSRFEVRLPVRAPVAPGTSEFHAPVPPAPASANAPRVLVVDDEPRIAASISRLFAREMRIVADVSARRALARLEEEAVFDVVICDLMMPDMDGIEFFGEIQRRWPRLAHRVVFLTGGAFTPESAAFLESLSNPVVAKPFDPDELRGAIEGVLRRSGDQAAVASRNP
jgi:two-component system cell cycle sensor histidine kinase/response regulator CckA